MERGFSTFEIIEALRLKRERLREWMNRGFIRPSIQEARGQGTKALFSRGDVYRIALFRNLVESGFTRLIASTLATPRIEEVIDAQYLICRWQKRTDEVFVNVRTGETHVDKYFYAVGGWTRETKTKVIDLRNGRDPKHAWDLVMSINQAKLKMDVDAELSKLRE